MVMTNFLQKRRTVREFQPTKLSAIEMDWLKDTLAKLEKKAADADVSFALFEDGKAIADALKGKAGYGGTMIEAPYYIALKAKSHEKAEMIRTGYYLEMMNTELIEKNFGTCWITTVQVNKELKQSLFGEGGEFVDYIIGFGKAEKQDVFDEERVSPRYSVDKIVFKDHLDTPASLTELENYGLFDVFSSIRFAPSHINAQPWRFLLKEDGTITLYLDKSKGQKSYVDIGVVMYYYEAMLKNTGTEKTWTLIEGADVDGLEPVAMISL
ncbi:MAG: nitroreductase family protein [Peptoniphilus sp.]|nr:nitroreductase family protein [Peptoniphilus sp.]MDY3118700.1 nitroreductase family protein [Peptoniphilus sp.]